jgi:hypothetical protein
MQRGRALYVTAVAQVGDTTPLQLDDLSTPIDDESTYRSGAHVYHVDEVVRDVNGQLIGIQLRDPWGPVAGGPFRILTDLTRIYFCLGPVASARLLK